jgi:nicotinamide mononucleotide adenylyltransferase
LVPAADRVAMCKLAVESSDWIEVDPWESEQKEYQTTLVVLDHFDHFVNKNREESDRIQVKLLCGGDLLDSFNTPGIWAPEDIEDILTKYGIFVLERTGTDAASVVFNNDLLYKISKNIAIIKQWISNDISSTKIRQNIARGLSIKYLTPDGVVDYIQRHLLYSNVKL